MRKDGSEQSLDNLSNATDALSGTSRGNREPYKAIERYKLGRGRQVQNGTQPDPGDCIDLKGSDEEVNQRKLSTMGEIGSRIAGPASGCGEPTEGR